MTNLPVTAGLAALVVLALLVCALAHVTAPAVFVDVLPLLVAGHLGALLPARHAPAAAPAVPA